VTNQQIEHIEKQMICFIDCVIDKEEKATPAEIAALPEVTLALAKIHQI